jgi:hypothetical protein
MPNPDSEDRFERAGRVLLEEILARLPDDEPLRARLLGTTSETFRRRATSLSLSR